MLVALLIAWALLTVCGLIVFGVLTAVLGSVVIGSVAGGALLLAGQMLSLVAVLRIRGQSEEKRARIRLTDEADRARRLVLYDETAGVLATWYFEVRLHEEILRSKRHQIPLTLFTLIPGEDGITRDMLAPTVLRSVQETDLVGAVSTSGLAVCILHCDWQRATSVLRRLMAQLPGEGSGYVVGTALIPDDGADANELLALALSRAAPLRTSTAA